MRGRNRRASARQSAAGASGLRGRGQQRAQLGIVAGLSGHAAPSAARPRAIKPRAQIERGHAGDRALHLLAVREQQLAERAPRRLAAHRGGAARGDPLLALGVQRVQARDDDRRRPVAEHAFEHVDARWCCARHAAFAARCRPRRSSAAPARRRSCQSRARRAPASPARPAPATTCWSAPRGENRATTSSRAPGPAGCCSSGRDARRLRSTARRGRTAERVAERLEHDARSRRRFRGRGVLAAQLLGVERQRRDRAGSAAACRAGQRVRARWRQRLEDQARLEEVLFVGDAADARRPRTASAVRRPSRRRWRCVCAQPAAVASAASKTRANERRAVAAGIRAIVSVASDQFNSPSSRDGTLFVCGGTRRAIGGRR